MRPKQSFLKAFHFLDKQETVDSEESLVYVHIGKCGGRTLWDALKSSTSTAGFANLYHVHIDKPPVLKHAKYAIVIRNPIQRAISAFNWRHKLVVQEKKQIRRFKGEYDALVKYGNINKLAESLYVGDELELQASRDFLTIHHLKEDVNFYLGDLLKSLSVDQLFAVFATESLNRDIENQLGVHNESNHHENSSSTPDVAKQISSLAATNLRKFLARDYACLEQLLDINHLCEADRTVLLK